MGSNGNGHGPIPFPAERIPIVGQAFTPKGGFPTAMITCGCEAKTPILLIANSPAQCGECKRIFVIQKFAVDNATGQMQLAIGLVAQQQPALAGA